MVLKTRANTQMVSCKPKPFYLAKTGRIYQGDALDVLPKCASPKSVDLIMTSPPFGLVRKKDYGNVDAKDYVEWFKRFGEEFKRMGSLNNPTF